MKTPGFRITSGKGFHITFANGWTASVQFGPGNYCGHHHAEFADTHRLAERGSPDAEIAAWPEGGGMMAFDGGDTVKGWNDPADVLAFLNEIAAKPRTA